MKMSNLLFVPNLAQIVQEVFYCAHFRWASSTLQPHRVPLLFQEPQRVAVLLRNIIPLLLELLLRKDSQVEFLPFR